jgi:hypothetical protein
MLLSDLLPIINDPSVIEFMASTQDLAKEMGWEGKTRGRLGFAHTSLD